MPAFDAPQDGTSMRARAWVDELPPAGRTGTGPVTHTTDATTGLAWDPRTVAVSLDFVSSIPRSGLLGGRFVPRPTGPFTLILPATPVGDAVPHDSAPLRRAGLPQEFHAAVIAGLVGRRARGETLPVPSGELHLDVAEYDEVGSSELVFLRVARALRHLLATPGELGPSHLQVQLEPLDPLRA